MTEVGQDVSEVVPFSFLPDVGGNDPQKAKQEKGDAMAV